MVNLYDPNVLEKSLHNDLNTLIKNSKIRQEQYQKLLQTNQDIINIIKTINDNVTIIVTDQLINFTNILQQLQTQHQNLKIEQIQIEDKYKGIHVNNQSIIRLMGRVGIRLLEMFQFYYEKIKPNNIQDKYKKMRNMIMKNINQKDKIDISQFNHIVIEYLHEKINQEITNLSNFINILQIGQPDQIYQAYYKTTINNLVDKKKLNQTSQQTKKQKDKIKEKLQQIKQQNQNNQKIRKNKNKILNLIVNGLYSTMELSKNHLVEDIVCFNPKDKCKKLYEEIYSRNKLNHQQIMAFQAKSEEFYQKVKKFKQLMQAESKKIQEAIIIKAMPKKQIILPTIEHNIPLLQVNEVQQKVQQTISDEDQHSQIEVLSVRIMGEKKTSNNNMNIKIIEEVNQVRQNILKKNMSYKNKQSYPFYSMQVTQQTFQHIKFDTRQQQVYLRSNRARLPQIINKPGQNFQNRRKSTKNDQRINIATQININGQSQKPRFSSKIQNFIQKNQQTDKKKDSLPKSFQYTFYAKKRTNRFYETRNNFII